MKYINKQTSITSVNTINHPFAESVARHFASLLSGIRYSSVRLKLDSIQGRRKSVASPQSISQAYMYHQRYVKSTLSPASHVRVSTCTHAETGRQRAKDKVEDGRRTQGTSSSSLDHIRPTSRTNSSTMFFLYSFHRPSCPPHCPGPSDAPATRMRKKARTNARTQRQFEQRESCTDSLNGKKKVSRLEL
jgi:hypothetical protein